MYHNDQQQQQQFQQPQQMDVLQMTPNVQQQTSPIHLFFHGA
jgi:hypothetical protein